MFPTCKQNFLCMCRTCRRGTAYTCLSARDYRFKSDSSLDSFGPPFVSPRPVAPRLSPYPFPDSLGLSGDLFVSSPYPKHYFKRSVHTPRRAEEQEAAGRGRGTEDGGEGCFAGGKIFLTAFASPPTSDFSHSSLRSLPPFRRGTFSTDACAFPDFISLGKIIVAPARSHRLRRARPRACVCTCVRVNDARTMALNWRLTGEQ